MSQKKKWKGRAHKATADEMFQHALLGEDHLNQKLFDPRQDRKTRQLCQQVRRALMLALAGECGDDILREVYVDAVEPMGNGSQLLVRVTVPSAIDRPLWDIVARLNDRSVKLRAIVAHSICRKRAPALTFVALPESPQSFQGGAP